jgi:hypothetical protein
MHDLTRICQANVVKIQHLAKSRKLHFLRFFGHFLGRFGFFLWIMAQSAAPPGPVPRETLSKMHFQQSLLGSYDLRLL